MKTKIRRLVGGVIFILSLAVLLWGAWPVASQERELIVTARDMLVYPNMGEPAKATSQSYYLAVPEQRRLFIEYPVRLRTGDLGLITLRLEVDSQGVLTATIQAGSESTQAEPILVESVYDTHTVVVEARLEMAGMEFRPQGVLAQALLPDAAVQFIWNVLTDVAGAYDGAVWVYLRFTPRNAGEETRHVLSAQRLKIDVISLLGLRGSTARLWGSVGTVIGSILGMDGIFLWIWKRSLRVREAKEGSPDA